MNTPVVLGAVFGIIMVMLPNFTPDLLNAGFLATFMIVFVIPLFFSNRLVKSGESFFHIHHSIGKKIISIHGILFLSIFQIFALLCSIDYLLSHIFGDAHNIALLGTIVASGLIAVTGIQRIVSAVYMITGTAVVSGLALLLINGVFFNIPLATVFHPSLFQLVSHVGTVSLINQNALFVIASMSIIVFWLLWMEPVTTSRVAVDDRNRITVKSAVISGIILSGVFVVFSGEFGFRSAAGGYETSLLDEFVIFTAIAGLFGLFVSSFHSVGVQVAHNIYPQFAAGIVKEKQELIEKLSTVFSVIGTILLIPVVRNAGGEVITWYIMYLTFFTGPIVAAFFILVVSKKINGTLLSMSLLAGECYALSEFASISLFQFSLLSDTANFYPVLLVSSFITIVSYAIGLRVGDISAVQKMLARMKLL